MHLVGLPDPILGSGDGGDLHGGDLHGGDLHGGDLHGGGLDSSRRLPE